MTEVEEVKSKTDIVSLISEFVPIKKSGRNWKGLCPFHGEKTPSFMVSQELQIYKCFGCGEGGDVFAFLMKMENIEFGEALRILAKKAGVELKERIIDTPVGRQKEKLYKVNHLAEEFYHYLLMNHNLGKAALAYVKGRGIRDETLELFKVGFSPNMWDGLQRFMVGKKATPAEDLEAAGLAIRRSGAGDGRQFYDRFRGRLVFPLKDHRGNTVGFAGRIIPGVTSEEHGESVDEAPKYINSPETPVYHKGSMLFGLDVTHSEVKKADQAILVEGELDMMSSYQAGVKNVAAVKGTALTEEQVRLLKRFAAEILIALDADIAGDMAARRGIQIADEAGLSIKVVRLKYGKDPDECARHDPELWKQSVAEAIPVYEYLMDSAVQRYGVSTAEGKRRIGRELIPLWAKISDPIMRVTLTRDLAKRLEVDEGVIAGEVEKARAGGGEEAAAGAVRAETKKTRRELLEEYLLALGFQKDPGALLADEVRSLLRESAAIQIVGRLAESDKPKGIKVDEFKEKLPAELQMYFAALMLTDLEEVSTDEEKWKKEFEKTKREIEKIDIKEELTTTSKEVVRLEAEGQTDELTAAQKKMSAVMSRMKQLDG